MAEYENMILTWPLKQHSGPAARNTPAHQEKLKGDRAEEILNLTVQNRTLSHTDTDFRDMNKQVQSDKILSQTPTKERELSGKSDRGGEVAVAITPPTAGVRHVNAIVTEDTPIDFADTPEKSEHHPQATPVIECHVVSASQASRRGQTPPPTLPPPKQEEPENHDDGLARSSQDYQVEIQSQSARQAANEAVCQ